MLLLGAGYIAEVTIRVMDFSSAITTIERIQVGIQIYSWFTLLSSSFVTCLSARVRSFIGPPIALELIKTLVSLQVQKRIVKQKICRVD